MLRVMSYIEQNPVRAGLAEKPTDYPHCSAGRKAKALEKGEEPEIEGFGILKKCTGVEHLRIWLLIQNYMAVVLRTRPGERLPAAPDVINDIFSPGHAVHWRMSFLKGAPSNWTTQAYGSEAYIKSIVVVPPAILQFLNPGIKACFLLSFMEQRSEYDDLWIGFVLSLFVSGWGS